MSVEKINQEQFAEKVKNSKNSKVLVDCYADWCGPCQMLSPVIDDLAESTENCDFYKINIDESEQVVEKYEIMSIPTILFFKDGELKEKLVGFKSRSELEELINS